MTALPMGFERRYISERSTVAHFVDVQSPWHISKCGKYPFGTWRGTGNQTERDRAAALPACRRCDLLMFGKGTDGQ